MASKLSLLKQKVTGIPLYLAPRVVEGFHYTYVKRSPDGILSAHATTQIENKVVEGEIVAIWQFTKYSDSHKLKQFLNRLDSVNIAQFIRSHPDVDLTIKTILKTRKVKQEFILVDQCTEVWKAYLSGDLSGAAATLSSATSLDGLAPSGAAMPLNSLPEETRSP